MAGLTEKIIDEHYSELFIDGRCVGELCYPWWDRWDSEWRLIRRGPRRNLGRFCSKEIALAWAEQLLTRPPEPKNKTLDMVSFSELQQHPSHDPYRAIEAKRYVEYVLVGLKPQQRKVIELRVFERCTMAEAGERLGVSGSRIQQIEQAALRRLRLSSSAKQQQQG